MQKHFNTFMIFFFATSLLYSHEEPPKTHKEREEKLNEHQRIAEQQIRIKDAYQTSFDSSGIPAKRYLYLRTEYADNGAMLSISQFEQNGQIKATARHQYDQHLNMISDADYDRIGQLLEKAEYRYDDSGRVVSADIYQGERRKSIFVYERHPMQSLIRFSKYTAGDTLEYRIDYVYTSPLDRGLLLGAYRYLPTGDTTLAAEYRYNDAGKIKEKWVYGKKRELLHRFLYAYDSAGNRVEIVKILPGMKTDWTQRFRYDTQSNLIAVETRDSKKRMKSLLEYHYARRP